MLSIVAQPKSMRRSSASLELDLNTFVYYVVEMVYLRDDDRIYDVMSHKKDEQADR